MLRRVHSLFGGYCARVNRDRIFNGEVFDTPGSLEAFEATQWNRDPTTTPAPCAAPQWADADDRPSHSDSIMVAIELDELCSFDGRPTPYVLCVIFFAPQFPFNQKLVCIQSETEKWFRNRLELEAGAHALQMIQHMILGANLSIKQVVIKTSPFLVRTATVQLPMLEGADGLLTDANADRRMNGEALLALSRSIRGLENMGILVQFFPVPNSRNQKVYTVAGHMLLSRPWEADMVAEQQPSATHTSHFMQPKLSAAWNGERTNADLEVLFISLHPLPDDEPTALRRRLFRASWRHKMAIDIWTALDALETKRPINVLVTGTDVLRPSARQLLKQLRKNAEDGATVVFCYFLGDGTTPTGYAFQEAFSSNFGLHWRLVPYRCLESFSPNPYAVAPITAAGLPCVYRPRAGGLFEGVLCRDALLLPSTHVHVSETRDRRGWFGGSVDVERARGMPVSSAVPAAMAPVGRGWVGVVGNVGADGETDDVVYSMCGFI